MIARIAVIASIVPTTLLSIAYSSGAISTWWIELLQYVPYPAHLVPALIALGLSFTLGWRWRAVALLSVGLIATVIMGLVLGHADSGSSPVRMMTYNAKAYHALWRPQGIENLEQEIASHHPDILVMQDSGDLTEARVQHPELGASIFEGRHVFAQSQYIVATRFPLRDCALHDMSYRNRHGDYVHCIVTVDGRDIDLYTAHLISPRRGLNAARYERVDGVDDWQQNFADRLEQSHKLAADIAARGRPMILAGDLNASEPSPVIRTLLATGLRDAFSSAGWGYGYTLGHALRLGFSFLRIDHVLVSPEIGVADAFPGGKQASEHRPVIADLLLERSK
ncbi:MAG TPA: endonuclease/exonuclease/phosphatase family protein [Burkholderiaceae bacterium]